MPRVGIFKISWLIIFCLFLRENKRGGESMNEVSIIMASYQGEKYISEQLKSFIKSNYQDWNLLICDDGSSDSTIDIIKKYVSLYPEKIRLHMNRNNLGFVKNFFGGLMLASGMPQTSAKYYMFSDQDDVWLADKMDKMVNRMKKMEKKHGENCPLLIFSDALIVDDNLNILRASYHKSQKLNVRNLDLPHMLMENKCSGCMMMVNSALVKKMKQIPEHARYHDWWLALIAASFGHISYINQTTVMYRQHENNIVGNQDKKEYLKNRLRNLNKQKDTLRASRHQAEEFLNIYGEELTRQNKEIIRTFSRLHKVSWFRRRIDLFRYGYFKSTAIRNIGILLIL